MCWCCHSRNRTYHAVLQCWWTMLCMLCCSGPCCVCCAAVLVDHAASALQQAGILPGGKVGILSANNEEWMITAKAVDVVGACVGESGLSPPKAASA